MKNKGIKKILSLLLAIEILFFSIISLDSEHTNMCHDDNCIICLTIHFSQIVVMMAIIVVILIKYDMFLLSYYLAKVHETTKNKVVILNSLVFRKVQFNE